MSRCSATYVETRLCLRRDRPYKPDSRKLEVSHSLGDVVSNSFVGNTLLGVCVSKRQCLNPVPGSGLIGFPI